MMPHKGEDPSDKDDSVVKNVKQFVTKFESSRQAVRNNSETTCDDKISKNQKVKTKTVAALRKSIEKSMQQEFKPQRAVPSLGRSLADVKDELCRSMDLSSKMPFQPLKFPASGINTRHPNYLMRFNSTDVLSKLTESEKRTFPVPAPRNFITKRDKRYKSSSDLTADLAPMHLSSYKKDFLNETFSENNTEETSVAEIKQERLSNDMSKVDGLSHQFEDSKCSRTPENTSDPVVPKSEDERLPSTNSSEGSRENSLNQSEIRVEAVEKDANFEDSSITPEVKMKENSKSPLSSDTCSTTSNKPCLKVSPLKHNQSDKTQDASKHCWKLSHFEWNECLECVTSQMEKQFCANVRKWAISDPDGEKFLELLDCWFNFDLIIDILVTESDSTMSKPLSCSSSDTDLSRVELHSSGIELENKLMLSLDDITKDLLHLMTKEEEDLLRRLSSSELNSSWTRKFDSLLKEVDKIIDLLFLLNRMMHSNVGDDKINSCKRSAQESRLNEAKELKKGIDIKCQKVLAKLESLLPQEIFEECFNTLSRKLSLKLKKECLCFKLMSLAKIIKLLNSLTF